MIRKAVILCGGWGTRFLPVTKAVSKELLPLFDTPILQILVDDLISNGITEIAFIIRPDKTDIVKYFTKHTAFESVANITQIPLLQNYKSANFYFISQNSSRGTGDAISYARQWVGDEKFFVLNGDEVFKNNPTIIHQMLEAYSIYNSPLLAVKDVDKSEVNRYGIVDIKENCRIVSIIEKPKPEQAPSNLASLGLYLFEPSILNYIHKSDDMPITDAVDMYVKNNFMYAVKVKGERYDLGTPLGYVMSNLSFALSQNQTKDTVNKKLNELGYFKK